MILRRRCIHAPIFVFLFVTLIAKATCASEMPLGEVIIQLRSGADTNTIEMHETVGDVTEDYLNQYFDAYYTRTEEISPNYFSGLTLSTNSFGVHGVEGSYITTIEIEGTLSFNSDELPSSFFIGTLLRNAFTGHNEQLYVDQLRTIDDRFLKNLAYLIIDINNGGVIESPIREHDTSATKNVGATSSSNEEEPAGSEENSSRKKWVTVIIFILALIIISCSYYAYRRYKQRAIENGGDGNNQEPMKVIKLPVKKKQSSSSRPSSNKESQNKYNDTRISPTSTASTLPSPGSIACKMVSPAKMDRLAPSPQRSMTSQASSKFTYTDNMSRFTTNNAKNNVVCTSPGIFSKCSIDVSRFTANNGKNDILCASPGNFSKFSLDVPSIDLGTWRGGRKDPPAFGSDISVIEKPKDTSLMPEDLKDIEAGLKKKNRNNGRTRNNTSNRHLPRKSRVALDARHSKSRFSNRSETYFYNGRHASSNDNNSNDGALDMTNDVIGDLNNLSMQIHRERTGRR